jgi:cell cycle sensor histidine kinase DivJ
VTDPAPSSEPSDVLATLAHELKTPLTAVAGYADAMRARAFGPLSDKYAECADIIHQAATHMATLIDGLAAADEGHAPFERFDARAPVAEAVRLFALDAEAAGVSLIADVPEAPIMVDAAARTLRQIAINLAANALAATARGGRVNVSLARDGADLILAVEDSGRGAAIPGKGLGLPLVRALCARHGGDFTLEAAPGGGARAAARLPVIAPS